MSTVTGVHKPGAASIENAGIIEAPEGIRRRGLRLGRPKDAPDDKPDFSQQPFFSATRSSCEDAFADRGKRCQ